VFLAESRHGLITDYRVLEGNPVDAGHVPPSLTQHQATFGRAPALYAADRGFYTPVNIEALIAAGVGTACVPQRGGRKTAARTAHEKSRAFKTGQRFLAFSGDMGPGFSRETVLPRGTTAAGLAVRDHRSVVTPDLLADPRITLGPEARARIERSPHRAALSVPLAIQDRVIGALSVGEPAHRVFDSEEIALTQTFADQAALALENARLYAEVTRARDFLRSITESSPDGIVTGGSPT
jgi:GAF domain-containing protein